jgi:hypothetical protein
MSSSEDHALEAAIEDLYDGMFETFVSRRDALSKELRASGDRAAAATVKALRKPSRASWALNLIVHKKPDSMDVLEAAIREAVASPPSGDEVRASIAGLRAAIRQFAINAAQVAGDAGLDVEVDDLAAALSAVLGNAESFAELRRGQLTDVPDAGGLDLLALLPTLSSEKPLPRARSRDAGATASNREGGRRAPSRAAKEEETRRARQRAAAEEAASKLAAAKKRAEEARKALRDTEAKVEAAEARVREAEDMARHAVALRAAAQKELDLATAAVESADEALRRLET